MNILYDHTTFQRQRYGGISRYFYELTTRLSATDGVGVNLFQGLHVNEYGLSDHRSEFQSYCGYKWGYDIPATKYMSHILTIPNKLFFENICVPYTDFDIYHPTYYMKGLRKIKKTPIVLTVYDMIHELYSDQVKGSGSVIKAKKRAFDLADVIISISENTKQDLMKIYDIPKSKIKVIYLASSLNPLTKFNRDYLKNVCGLKHPYILYVGDRSPYKNFNGLLNSYIDSFSDDFDLVCFGGAKFKQDELEHINGGIKRNVIQLSGMDELLSSLYKHAFCLVYPSFYEGFGIPPLEAMSCGCPVIASNTSSIPEVVGDAAILFNPNSNDKLTGCIESLYNESQRNDLTNRGFEHEKKFSFEKTVAETIDVYKGVLNLDIKPMRTNKIGV